MGIEKGMMPINCFRCHLSFPSHIFDPYLFNILPYPIPNPNIPPGKKQRNLCARWGINIREEKQIVKARKSLKYLIKMRVADDGMFGCLGVDIFKDWMTSPRVIEGVA